MTPGAPGRTLVVRLMAAVRAGPAVGMGDISRAMSLWRVEQTEEKASRHGDPALLASSVLRRRRFVHLATGDVGRGHGRHSELRHHSARRPRSDGAIRGRLLLAESNRRLGRTVDVGGV